jgi:HEAT repeat protein
MVAYIVFRATYFRMASMKRSRLKLALLLGIVLLPAVPQTPESTPVRHARKVLDEGASDSDPDTRREAAVALGLAARRDPSTNLLRKLAADKDYLVREAALVTIGELHDAQLAKSAHDALDDDVPEVAFAAARTLYKLNQPEGKRLLIEIVQKEAPAKSSFLRAKLRDVTRRMKRPKSALLFVAREGVGFIPVPGLGEGFAAMNALVNDPDFSARSTALMVLSSDRSPDVRKEIEEAFNDGDWSMRASAIQIAASHNIRTWRFRVVPLLEDTNRRVRYRAAAAFLRLSAASSAPAQPAKAPTPPR